MGYTLIHLLMLVSYLLASRVMAGVITEAGRRTVAIASSWVFYVVLIRNSPGK